MDRSSPAIAETLGCAPVFSQLRTAELQQLVAIAQRRVYRRREVIFHQGDAADRLYVLESGCVALTVRDTEGARSAMLSALAPGDLFGELAILPGSTRCFTAEALETVAVVALPWGPVQTTLWARPAAVESFVDLLSQRIHSLSELVADRSFLGLEQRLAKTLLTLALQHGHPAGESVEIQVPLTQSDLASLLGAARTSVNRILSDYEEQGLIHRLSRHVTQVDVNGLHQLLG